MHNGEIFEIETLRRDLLFAIAPELFNNILGSIDSEIMFHLALTFGLESDPLGVLERMAGFIEQTGRAHGMEESLWMTVAVSDGKSLWAVRYASDEEAPTLYHSRDIDDVYFINPVLKNVIGRETRVVVSEPIGAFSEMWKAVPQNTAIKVDRGTVEMHAFESKAV